MSPERHVEILIPRIYKCVLISKSVFADGTKLRWSHPGLWCALIQWLVPLTWAQIIQKGHGTAVELKLELATINQGKTRVWPGRPSFPISRLQSSEIIDLCCFSTRHFVPTALGKQYRYVCLQKRRQPSCYSWLLQRAFREW